MTREILNNPPFRPRAFAEAGFAKRRAGIQFNKTSVLLDFRSRIDIRDKLRGNDGTRINQRFPRRSGA